MNVLFMKIQLTTVGYFGRQHATEVAIHLRLMLRTGCEFDLFYEGIVFYGKC